VLKFLKKFWKRGGGWSFAEHGIKAEGDGGRLMRNRQRLQMAGCNVKEKGLNGGDRLEFKKT